nr:unnamed protein product [Callosobruchus analis]
MKQIERRAYNSRGSGPGSEPVTARTLEDVPTLPPENVQCSVLNAQSLHISWEPPAIEGQNGIIQGYKVTYHSVGEWYVPSAPAAIKAVLSASNKILVSWLPPKFSNGPLTGYTFYMSVVEDGQEEGTHKRALNPAIEMHEVIRTQDTATLQFWVTASTRVLVPPEAPVLTVVESFTDSLHLRWKDQGNGGSPILGYVINYKRDHGDWEELQISARTDEHMLRNLWCGTKYLLYITAFNRIGTGLPCDIVPARTKGTAPVQPSQSHTLTTNATAATVWLDSWGDGGCGIAHFAVEWRRRDSSGPWQMAAGRVQPQDRTYTVRDLQPAAEYQLRVTAHNNAGDTQAIYNFTTLNIMGESDNLGSTDSEVKKILTLHLPISEYDALGGSDSEGDARAASQDLMSFSHRMRGNRKVARRVPARRRRRRRRLEAWGARSRPSTEEDTERAATRREAVPRRPGNGTCAVAAAIAATTRRLPSAYRPPSRGRRLCRGRADHRDADYTSRSPGIGQDRQSFIACQANEFERVKRSKALAQACV